MADIRITGRMVNFSRLTFDTNNYDAIRQQLNELLQDSPYEGATIIIDSTVEQNLDTLLQILSEVGLQTMAVMDGVLGDQARERMFPVLPSDRPLQRIKPTKEEAKDTKINCATHITSYHNDILRTGQCLVQEQGDIILNASMNSGSELIASGNVHIYGAAQGRIIAGASGNAQARIFCQVLNAELISIAGTYCVADDIPLHVQKKPAHIYLNEQQALVFETLEI
ncbi:septum site-determining protein MinC [Acinetobacter sp. HY1485]|uniref:septum site-determining protein MinC n=1 Tax=Acinetobacter sp. HY1485 TaxID=2970918 RepID=UPI0022B992CF|nr:septum site-determining protein MinC [Acinetobacter sp. HY1485]